MRPPKARRIVITVYEGVSSLDLPGLPRACFGIQQDDPRAKKSRYSVVAARARPQAPHDPPESAGLPRLGNHPNGES